MDGGFDVVTGAFSYTGRYIARRLLAMGRRVRTLTYHPANRHVLPEVEPFPYNVDAPERLVESLRGAETFYNTYWIRFAYGGLTFADAARNTRILVDAAKTAGVRRFVHFSVANADRSDIPYYVGKRAAEAAVSASGLSFAIIRPCLIYGEGDVLINNIAWLLRKVPFFTIPGKGDYRVQPIYAGDAAALAIEAAGRDDNVTIDATGPEVHTFEQLVRLINAAVGARSRIVHVPALLSLVPCWLAGRIQRDIVLTRDELRTVTGDLLVTDSPPTASGRISEWLDRNGDSTGVTYVSELDRHFR